MCVLLVVVVDFDGVECGSNDFNINRLKFQNARHTAVPFLKEG